MDMRYSLYRLLMVGVFPLLLINSITAQEKKGTITGHVTDATAAVLQGARIQLDPTAESAVSNADGNFTLSGINPGHYTVTVSYLGFAAFTQEVNVAAGSVSNLNAVLGVAAESEEITVHADREFGEVEALNRERTADNLLQVLPAEVITSLPNTNVADAIGRLPSVSLERDEGEGKYVQIRGTEPRLSNVTIDGVHVPSPENVRNVKLDVIPADLVDSVEISKTLSANQDGDAIGGSVNLVIKKPTDQPYFSILGMTGYTPIVDGRTAHQVEATMGQRFGEQKKFGILVGGSYDHNNRGINDVEPSPGIMTLADGVTTVNSFGTEDIRDYRYDRSRYGFGGGVDYKLGDMSSLYLRGLFSHFRDFGQDWIYTPTVGNFLTPTTTDATGNMALSNVYRKPVQQIFSLQTGAHVTRNTWLFNYGLALSQAHQTGGFSYATFNGPGNITDASGNSLFPVAFGVNTTSLVVPMFPVLNGVNIYDPTHYLLNDISLQNNHTFERDVVGDVSVAKTYQAGMNHFGTLATGFKVADGVKTQFYNYQDFGIANQTVLDPSLSGQTLLMSQVLGNYPDTNYYFGKFGPYGPTPEYNKVLQFFYAHPALFNGGLVGSRSYPNDFNVGERVYAGYVMNTIGVGKFRIQTGVRVEGTQDQFVGTAFQRSTGSITPVPGSNDYTNVLPSVQLQYRITDETVARFGFGIGIARPNFGDLPPYLSINDVGSRKNISAGNPNLLATSAKNYDLVIEHYLKPLGIIQVGGFYKDLTDPIYVQQTRLTSGSFAGFLQNQPVNGPRAHIGGIEMSWRQELRFLPGAMKAFGISANYSWTTSRADLFTPAGATPRTDHPPLLRDAPNNWNFDVTYDKWGLSARMGLTHNDAYLWSYNYVNQPDNGPVNGPNGDVYLYPHTQVDAQVSYLVPKGRGVRVIASMLNLNNEVFGFYQGSEQFPIQREYYSPTYSFGLRWVSSPETK
jgi:TonB-dependent receptor